MRIRSLPAATLVWLLGAGVAAAPFADEDFVGLLKAGEEVARAGYAAEARELLEVLAGMGLSDEGKEKAGKALDRRARLKPSEPERRQRTMAGPAEEKIRLQLRFPHAGLIGHLRRMRYLVEENRYTVVAEIAVEGGRRTWSFTTGKAR